MYFCKKFIFLLYTKFMLPLPDVTKNLLIINVLMFLAQITFAPVTQYLAVYSPVYSDNFQPYQLVTYMFLHSPTSLMHIFFNMFALYSFGRDLEYSLGAKKFLLLYLFAGLAAIALHLLVQHIEYSQLAAEYGIEQVKTQIGNKSPTLGASGSVFGLLAAFGMLYPNRVIMLLIPPIPMKAKYFVLIFGALELFLGFQGSKGVAHFAHVGGAIFAALLILWWRKKGERF